MIRLLQNKSFSENLMEFVLLKINVVYLSDELQFHLFQGEFLAEILVLPQTDTFEDLTERSLSNLTQQPILSPFVFTSLTAFIIKTLVICLLKSQFLRVEFKGSQSRVYQRSLVLNDMADLSIAYVLQPLLHQFFWRDIRRIVESTFFFRKSFEISVKFLFHFNLKSLSWR